MFRKVLVANRGEIARRVFQACRELGVASVGVHTPAESSAAWLGGASEVVAFGEDSPKATYLSPEAIIAAATACRADAVHPGYGFLSESPGFARACAAAGLAFIGPTPEAMERLGSKVGARSIAAASGVPVVPGLDTAGLDADATAAMAAQIGFPLLVKASAGGGGRGMRIVEVESDLASELQAARAEAVSAFGDGHLLVERYIPRARHVEVQILGDHHGTVVHLGERECSLQRRYQKVVEEAPAPGLAEAVRHGITEAAVRLARTALYTNAGTVEFLVDESGQYYLLEVNTRLQVEHPVTEAVTGLDIVGWQIRVAAGEALDFGQAEVAHRGHAIEVRLYAEDPARGFLPTAGRLEFYRPPSGPGIRVDDGYTQGEEVSTRFDPLLAKIVVHAADRPAAVRRLKAALATTIVLGVPTNLAYLQAIAANPAFDRGRLSTRFLDEELAEWTPPQLDAADEWLAAAVFEVLASRSAGSQGGSTPTRHDDPWAVADGWRGGQ